MSLLLCESCGVAVVEAEDPGAIIEAPTCIPYRAALDQILCENCRERAFDRATGRAMEEAP
jgi:hypothetical protein